MLPDRGVAAGHMTLFRWVQAYAGAVEQRVRRRRRPCIGSSHVDEAYIKAKDAMPSVEQSWKLPA